MVESNRDKLPVAAELAANRYLLGNGRCGRGDVIDDALNDDDLDVDVVGHVGRNSAMKLPMGAVASRCHSAPCWPGNWSRDPAHRGC